MQGVKLTSCLTVALLMSFGVTGCATTTKPAAPDFCGTAAPIFVSKADVITDRTARRILEHNLTGRKLCGW